MKGWVRVMVLQGQLGVKSPAVKIHEGKTVVGKVKNKTFIGLICFKDH